MQDDWTEIIQNNNCKENLAKLFYQYTYSIILYQLFEMFYNVWFFKDLFEVATCTI